jgi:hypothetical protein
MAWTVEYEVWPVNLNNEVTGQALYSQVVSQLARMKPTPASIRQKKFAKMEYGAELTFRLESESQFGAVEQQIEIAEKLQGALKVLSVRIKFADPTMIRE